MATKNHGKSTVFKVQDSGGTLTDLSSYITKDGLQRMGEALDATAKGQNSKSYAPGLFDGKVSIEIIWDPTVDALLAGILNLQRNFEYHPQGTGTGTPKYSGAVICTDFSFDSPLALITGKADFQITGDTTRGVN